VKNWFESLLAFKCNLYPYAQVILQGHHADDQTETVLLKLIRGCHLVGLYKLNPVDP
jgi:tRNA(Ile)-lysidine synthase TilS/MesJ